MSSAGDSTAPMGAYYLRGVEAGKESSEKKNAATAMRVTSVPMETLHFKTA